ncbi:SxtJ family membrane protein [Candidatus Omnitrophota bacterium]
MSFIEELKNIKSGKEKLRQFGKGGFIFFGLVGILLLIFGKTHWPAFFALSIAFLLLGACIPIMLKPVYIVLVPVAMCIGWVVTRIILTILFYFVVTPTGIAARLVGKDLLDEKLEKEKPSYWLARKDASFDKNSCENQF